MKILAIASATVLMGLAGLSPALAQSNTDNNGHTYALDDGTVHGTPGEMFQYLRDRDNGLATGNPKAIVDAYPDSYENVGDLVGQSRDRGEAAVDAGAAATADAPAAE